MTAMNVNFQSMSGRLRMKIATTNHGQQRLNERIGNHADKTYLENVVHEGADVKFKTSLVKRDLPDNYRENKLFKYHDGHYFVFDKQLAKEDDKWVLITVLPSMDHLNA
jgi:hypothetical protein